jgi:Phage integrase, N-terminal SAM-like domain
MQNGSYLAPDKTTFAEFAERWLTHVKSQVSPKSHERYSEIMRKNVVPLIGAVVLTKLKPAVISEAYAKALESGRRNGTGGLSPRTVHHMHRLIRQSLAQAVK